MVTSIQDERKELYHFPGKKAIHPRRTAKDGGLCRAQAAERGYFTTGMVTLVPEQSTVKDVTVSGQ